MVDRTVALPGYDTVRVDDAGLAHRAVAHLCAHGHRRVAFVGSDERFATTRDRLTGYRGRWPRSGSSPRPELVRPGPTRDVDGADVTGGPARAARTAHRGLRGQPPRRLGVAHALHTGDRADVAFVSFGDFPLATTLRPGVTVVDQDPVAIGVAAMEMVLAHLEGRASAGRDILVAAELVPRGSGEIEVRDSEAAPAGPQPGRPLLRRRRRIAALRGHRDDVRPTSPRSGSRRPCRAPMTTLSAWPSARTAAAARPGRRRPAGLARRRTLAGDPRRRHRAAAQAARRRAAAAGARAPRPRLRAHPPGLPLRQDRGLVRPRRRPGRGHPPRLDRGRRPRRAGRRSDAQDGDVDARADAPGRGPARGTGSWCPPDRSHAIGAGVFVVEVQEPTDFSIVLEWSVTTATREESHLGLGFDAAMGAVSHRALDPATLGALVRTADGPVGDGLRSCLPERGRSLLPARPRQARRTAVAAGFAVLLVLEGAALITVPRRRGGPGRPGEAWAVPHGFGDWRSPGGAPAARGPARAGWPADLAEVTPDDATMCGRSRRRVDLHQGDRARTRRRAGRRRPAGPRRGTPCPAAAPRPPPTSCSPQRLGAAGRARRGALRPTGRPPSASPGWPRRACSSTPTARPRLRCRPGSTRAARTWSRRSRQTCARRSPRRTGLPVSAAGDLRQAAAPAVHAGSTWPGSVAERARVRRTRARR